MGVKKSGVHTVWRFSMVAWSLFIGLVTVAAVAVTLLNLNAVEKYRQRLHHTLALELGPRTMNFLLRQDDFRQQKTLIILAVSIIGIVVGGNLTLFAVINRMHQRLRQGEETKSRMISSITHNANHYLAVIKGRVDLNLMKLEAGLPVVSLDQELELMSDNVRSLARLIDNLNCDELLRQGKVPFSVDPVELMPILRRVSRMAEVLEHGKKIDLALLVPSEAYRIQADAHWLEQILINLLHNAVKFSPPGGRIEVVVEATEATVCLWVRDQGPGVPVNQREFIFKPYARLPSRNRGTGLGLSNARALAHLMNAEVGIAEPMQGTGAAFYVVLQRVDGPLLGKESHKHETSADRG